MDITPLISKNYNIINSYGFLGFEINNITYKNSIILTKSQIIEVKINNIEDLFEQDFTDILSIDPEIFLIGTGKYHKIISNSLKNKIRQQYPQINISEMTTGSACRTYNILIAEDREVAVFLKL